MIMLNKHRALKASHESLELAVQRLRTEHDASGHQEQEIRTGRDGLPQQKGDRSGDRQNPSAQVPAAAEGGSVEVAAFEAHRDDEQRELRIAFSLLNRSGRERVSGYVCVVAQNTGVSPARCVLWPEGELAGDMPKDYRKGVPFSITCRKQVRGSIKLSKDIPGYTRIAVIVYDATGAIITHQDYSLDQSGLPARKP